MPEQLILDLPHLAAQGAEDFLVSSSNQAAVEMVGRWPDWSGPAVVLCGPSGVGKSHLINVWKMRSGATVIPAIDLDENVAGKLGPEEHLAVEDLHHGIASEKALFYRLNMAREHRGSLLMTSRYPPGELELVLPDLRSRLRAVPVLVIAPPDDALLQSMLVKLFADRQWHVEPAIIKFILTHMERSAEAANAIVAEMNHLALATQRKATRALAKEVIGKLFPIKH